MRNLKSWKRNDKGSNIINSDDDSSNNNSSSSSSSSKKFRSVAILITIAILSFVATKNDQRLIDGLSYLSSSSSSTFTTSRIAKTLTSTTNSNNNGTTTSTGLLSSLSRLTQLESTTPSTTTTTPTTSGNLTIVVNLAGELANHLYYMNRGIMLQKMAQQEASKLNMMLSINVLYRQQGGSKPIRKAKTTEKDLRRCFPYFTNASFTFGSSSEYDQLMDAQTNLEQWDFLTNSTLTDGLKSTIPNMKKSIRTVVEGIYQNSLLQQQQEAEPTTETTNNTSNVDGTNTTSSNTTTILPTTVRWNSPSGPIDVSLPIIDVGGMAQFSIEYEDDLRHAFRMNEEDPHCCNVRAGSNETVYHFRNFVEEMPRQGIRLGFEELSPQKVANELFYHAKVGDQIAIVTRFQKSSKVIEIKDAIEQVHPGVTVRVIGDNSGVQDFCLLKTAEHEITGNLKSTFARWASYVGNAQRARLHILDTPVTRKQFPGDPLFAEAVELMTIGDRVRFEIYRNEEMDRLFNSTTERSKIPKFKELDQLAQLIRDTSSKR